MKAQENENQNIFEYHINDHLLCQQSLQVNFIQSLPQQYKLETQKSLTVDPKSQLVERDRSFEKDLDCQVSSDQKSYQNNRIVHMRSKQMAQQKGNSNLIRNYYLQRNRNRYLYNQMRTLKQQQVEMKESHEQFEKRIKQFEFQDRMLKCYYWLKYFILLILILIPILLLALRKH